jgi:hypothetical protein
LAKVDYLHPVSVVLSLLLLDVVDDIEEAHLVRRELAT